MILIPIKWLFHWEYTLFSDKPTCFQAAGWDLSLFAGVVTTFHIPAAQRKVQPEAPRPLRAPQPLRVPQPLLPPPQLQLEVLNGVKVPNLAIKHSSELNPSIL